MKVNELAAKLVLFNSAFTTTTKNINIYSQNWLVRCTPKEIIIETLLEFRWGKGKKHVPFDLLISRTAYFTR